MAINRSDLMKIAGQLLMMSPEGNPLWQNHFTPRFAPSTPNPHERHFTDKVPQMTPETNDVIAMPKNADFPYYYGMNTPVVDEDERKRILYGYPKDGNYRIKSLRQTPRGFYDGFDPESFMV